MDRYLRGMMFWSRGPSRVVLTNVALVITAARHRRDPTPANHSQGPELLVESTVDSTASSLRVDVTTPTGARRVRSTSGPAQPIFGCRGSAGSAGTGLSKSPIFGEDASSSTRVGENLQKPSRILSCFPSTTQKDSGVSEFKAIFEDFLPLPAGCIDHDGALADPGYVELSSSTWCGHVGAAPNSQKRNAHPPADEPSFSWPTWSTDSASSSNKSGPLVQVMEYSSTSWCGHVGMALHAPARPPLSCWGEKNKSLSSSGESLFSELFRRGPPETDHTPVEGKRRKNLLEDDSSSGEGVTTPDHEYDDIFKHYRRKTRPQHDHDKDDLRSSSASALGYQPCTGFSSWFRSRMQFFLASGGLMPACEVALLSVLSALWRSEIEPSWKQISSFEEIVQGNWLPPARSNKIIHLKRTLKQIQRRWMLGSSTSPVPFTSSSRAPPLLSSSSSVQRTTREPARGSSPDEKNFIKEDGSAPENLNLRPRGGNCSPIARSIIRKMWQDCDTRLVNIGYQAVSRGQLCTIVLAQRGEQRERPVRLSRGLDTIGKRADTGAAGQKPREKNVWVADDVCAQCSSVFSGVCIYLLTHLLLRGKN